MCKKTYQHPGIEYSNQRENSAAMKSLKWAIEKEIRELKLKDDGINLIYCAHAIKNHKEHEIEIQESRGKYSFFLNGKSVYSTDNLADAVSWGKAAGYIDKNEKIGESRKAPAKPAATKPTTDTTRKSIPATTATDKLAKYWSWKSPSTGHPGWR